MKEGNDEEDLLNKGGIYIFNLWVLPNINQVLFPWGEGW